MKIYGLLCSTLLASWAVAYDPAVGLQLAYLEKAVYCGAEKFESWAVGDSIKNAPQVNTSQLRFVHSAATNGAAGVGRMLEPDGCFVAMRGTVGPISSILDAKFWLTDFGRPTCMGCRVDYGFKENYESIKDGIFGALQEFGCKDRALYLTGHSLGAAGLHFLTFDALELGYEVAHMYALESPRPGDPKFAEQLRAKAQGIDTWRVAHYQDVVVHIPPQALYFEHPFPEIYYDHEQGTHYKECGIEDKTCSSQWWIWQTTAKDHDWFADVDPCSCSDTALLSPRGHERLAFV